MSREIEATLLESELQNLKGFHQLGPDPVPFLRIGV